MSIHKSKGLEFPIAFLVNTNKQFNEQDIRKNPVLLHQDLGIGAKYINYNAQVQYDTLTREAIKNVVRNENISEEMRILYVALTRARKKVFLVTIKNQESNFAIEIKSRYGEDMKQEQFECPLCGGRLLKKSGPYGEFFGCSNYKTTGFKYKRKIVHREVKP